MRFIRILLSLLFLILGLGYLYRPHLIVKFNLWMKQTIFNDELLINHRRKVGLILVFVSLLLLFIR